MAWPPPAMPINRTNANPQQDTHPADHNALGQAINDIVTKQQGTDSYVTGVNSDLQALKSRTDKAVGGYGTALIGSAISGSLRAVVGHLSATSDAFGHVLLNWGAQGFGSIWGVVCNLVDQTNINLVLITGGGSGNGMNVELRLGTTGALLPNQFVHFTFIAYGA